MFVAFERAKISVLTCVIINLVGWIAMVVFHHLFLHDIPLMADTIPLACLFDR